MADFIPDAVMVPLGHSGPGDAATRLTRLHAEFAAILQAFLASTSATRDHVHFLTASPADTLLFPQIRPPFRAAPLSTGPIAGMGSPMVDARPMREFSESIGGMPGAAGRLVRLADGL